MKRRDTFSSMEQLESVISRVNHLNHVDYLLLSGGDGLDVSSLGGNLFWDDGSDLLSCDVLGLFSGPEFDVEWMAQEWSDSTVSSVGSSSALGGGVGLNVSDDQCLSIEGLCLES